MAQTQAPPQRFVIDDEGHKVGVLLSLERYSEIMDELEELGSIRAYDAAKASGEEPVSFPLSDAEREKIDRRLDAYRRDPDAASPWPEVKERILSRA